MTDDDDYRAAPLPIVKVVLVTWHSIGKLPTPIAIERPSDWHVEDWPDGKWTTFWYAGK